MHKNMLTIQHMFIDNILVTHTFRSHFTILYICLSSLARSANLPKGLYILPMFFLYLFFFYFFLMVDFLANVAETLIEQSSPKFQDS